jgi:hypothetical protein
MTVQTLVLVLALGAALLALWIDVRFPRLAPQDFRTAALHVLAALLTVQLLLASGATHWGSASPAAMVASMMTVSLPALTYEFLAALWLIKLTQALFRSYR